LHIETQREGINARRFTSERLAVKEMSAINLVREKWPKTVYC